MGIYATRLAILYKAGRATAAMLAAAQTVGLITETEKNEILQVEV